MATSDTGQKADGANGSTVSIPRSDTAYPYYSVQEAIKVAEAVQKAGGSSATEKEVAAALSLTSTQSRSWSYRISSAREFGLIERTGRGDAARILVTDLFMAYSHPGSDAEKRAALMQIIMKPALYGPLLQRYRGAPKPDVGGVANVMMREHGILTSVKEDAAKAFLASIDFAGIVTNGVVASVGIAAPPPALTPGETPALQDVKDDKPGDRVMPPDGKPGVQYVEVPDNFIVYRCKLGKGRVIEIPLPPEFTQADAKRLHAFLLTQVDDSQE